MSLDDFFDHIEKLQRRQVVERPDSFVETKWLKYLEIDECYINLVRKYYPEYEIKIKRDKVLVLR